MAVIQNNYVGNGSAVLYSFTFPYINQSDVKLSLNGIDSTQFIFANATTLQLNTAPAAGVAIRIYRSTASEDLQATFYPGSAIRAQDLNENFVQNLYVTQESSGKSDTAISTATGAVTTANTAIATANSSTAVANQSLTNSQTALSQSSAAVTTSNTAATSAANAVTTSNTATSSAATALSNSQTALTQSANAVTTANQSTTTAATALSNSQTALTQSAASTTQASTALTTANSALSTANTASTNASTALSTSNTANNKADQAINAVANAILYDLVANVAAIPVSPVNNDAVEVFNSTGIQSFTPLSGKPTGFIGDSGLSVRIIYSSASSTWVWVQYFPNDPENRYGVAITTVQADVGQLQTDVVSLNNNKLNVTTASSTYQPLSGMSSYLTTANASSTYAPLNSPTFTGTPVVPGYLTTTAASSTYQTQAGMTSYVTTTNAASTYQTQAGMSSYLTTANAATTYALTASPTLTGATYVNGSYRSNITAVSALDIDLSTANYFTKTISTNATFTFSNTPASRALAFVLELNHTSGTVTWPAAVIWPGGTAPTLTTGKRHLFILATSDGGTTWRASSLINYAS